MTGNDVHIAMPLLLLSGGAIAILLSRALTRDTRVGTGIGMLTATAAAFWQLLPPPAVNSPALGLAAGELSRLFSGSFALLAVGVLAISAGYNRHRAISGEEYPASVLFTTFGMCTLAAATNLLTLFLGLEAMGFGFYLLVAIDMRRETSGETGLKYLLPGVLSAAFLAFGIALLYCASGTLNIPEALQLGAPDGSRSPLAMLGWGFLLTGVAFKLSLAPAHLWTPDVYQGAPPPVTAFLSGGSKAATIVLLLLLVPRVTDQEPLREPLWTLAALSLLTGSLAALRQVQVKRLLAYSSIAQMGYLTMALTTGAASGYRAAAFGALGYAVISLAAFGALAVLERHGVGDLITDYRGCGFRHPWTAGVLALALLALAGIPPSVGFTAKFLVFVAALRAGEMALALVAVISSVLAGYYYLRLLVTLYTGQPEQPCATKWFALDELPLLVAAIGILVLGIWPTPLLAVLQRVFP